MGNEFDALVEVYAVLKTIVFIVVIIVFFVLANNVGTIAKILKRRENSHVATLNTKIAAEKFKDNKENAIDLLLKRAWEERNNFLTDSTGRAEMLHQTAIEIEELGGTVPKGIIDYLEKYKK